MTYKELDDLRFVCQNTIKFINRITEESPEFKAAAEKRAGELRKRDAVLEQIKGWLQRGEIKSVADLAKKLGHKGKGQAAKLLQEISRMEV